MTAPHKARVAFINHFRQQFQDRAREDCIQAANRFLRMTAVHQRLAEEARNAPPSVWKSPRELERWNRRVEAQTATIQARIARLAAEWGISVTVSDDPQEATVRLHLPDGRGNTPGGDADGWGVPTGNL